MIGKSGFVVFGESENVGTVSSRRLASGAGVRRVRAFSLASDGCGISGGLTDPVPVPVSAGVEVRGVDDAVHAVAQSIAPMRSPSSLLMDWRSARRSDRDGLAFCETFRSWPIAL